MAGKRTLEIPAKPGTRDIPAQSLVVIGAGFGRTGTSSLRAALEALGIAPCDHMEQTLAHPGRMARWRDAALRKRKGLPIDWRPLLEGYQGTVDWPAAYFWRELSAAHPQAKVILTVRDPERWYDSMAETLFPLHARVERSAWARTVLDLTGLADTALRDGYLLTEDLVWQETFAGRFADRQHAVGVFQEHALMVQATVPPERLLVFNVAEGWEPLCKFLGVPVPKDMPFPHVNDRISFKRRVWTEVVGQSVRYGGATLVGVLAIVVVLRAVWRLPRA